MQKAWFIATYGDFGLEVEFFVCPLVYGRRLNDVRRLHESGGWEIDTYQNGSVHDAIAWLNARSAA